MGGVLIVRPESGTSLQATSAHHREPRVASRRGGPGEWRKQAACPNHPELRWYRCSNEPLDRDAIAMCGGCSVRTECLAYAVEAHEPAGIWGGVEFPSGADAPERAR